MLRFQLKCLSNLLPLQLSGSQTIAAFTVAPQTRMFSIYQSSRTLSRCFHTCPVTNSNSKSRTGFLLLCITKGCQERKLWYYCAESVAATQDIKTKNIQWYLNHYTEQETGSSQTRFLDSQLLVYREKFGSLHLKLHMQFLDFKLSILILYVPQCQEKKYLCFRLLLFETRPWIAKAGAQRSLNSQINTSRTWDIKHTGLSFQRKRPITCCLPRMLGAGVVNSLVTFTLPAWLRLFHAKSSSRPASWAYFSQSTYRNYLHGRSDMQSVFFLQGIFMEGVTCTLQSVSV